MAVIFRHGGESHVMRPDGVMRTSVIRPFVGYNPQADVQAVARAFTTGGPLATQLSGLGGLGAGTVGGVRTPACINHYTGAVDPRYLVIRSPNLDYGVQCALKATTQQFRGLGEPGPIRTWWENLKARIANRKIEKIVEKAAIHAAIHDSSPGPEPEMGSQVAPQMQAQMHMLSRLTQSMNSVHVRGPLAHGMDMLAARRPLTWYRAG